MGLRMEEAAYAPGTTVARHTHEAPLLAAVLSGSLELSLRRGAHGCARGAVFTQAGEPHANRFGARGARLLLVHLDRPLALPPVVHGAELTRVARGLALELKATDSAAPLAREGLALQLMALATREAGRVTAERRWMARVQEYLEAHLLEAPRLETLARVAGVHPAHLARAFRAQQGESLAAYVRRRRVEWAREQLVRTERAVAEIALEAGFCDQGHFARTFRKVCGMTPGAVRQRRR
ncbi:helix-turn-helix transcriptional regulator [Aggregicoccus sp. 17bor-14]|uniref:helix-turn-helix transcriptional regulator n=1 Tax=Myxococcaceae TaxID=31 RepID=UPI00129C4931|nr:MULTISPECIES: AraC family transcriptional regulator [Myxococcaceae]MBF5043561.1 helix-turn-helix domain-containing protein [Simulacricoccus sp. 17bor-14]MRI89320.1 helix-turn-helix transcriptional regulator [Aggregicoccus sp. 17bor-14]